MPCVRVNAQTNDAQVWLGYEWNYKVWRNAYTHAKYQIRFTNNYSRIDYTFLDLGVDYDLTKSISITTAYVINMKNDIELGWIPRHQWYGNLIESVKFGKFKLSNREQFQSDIEDDVGIGGNWYFRNKTSLQYKLNKKISPFIYFEGYLRFGVRPPAEDFLNRTRYLAGIKYKVDKQNDLEAGFLLQRQVRRKQPDYVYALTITWGHSSK